MPKAPATAKVIAASWKGGTGPVAAVNSARSDHSAIAPRPVRVAAREDTGRRLRSPAFRSHHVLAAVDRQRRAGDEAAVLGGEEDDGAADLLRGAEAADRDQRNDLRLQDLGVDRLHHLGADVAGRDDVDGDPGARAFLGERLGEADVAGLRGRIVRLAGLALLAVDRGDGDDAAELAFAHAVPDRVRHVEDAVEVGVDHLAPLDGRHPVEHRVAGDAGVVDQDIDRAEVRLHLLDAGRAGLVVGDRPLVDRDAGLGLELVRRIVIAGVVRGDRVARRLQRLRDRGADAARAAGDECDACHVSSLPSCSGSLGSRHWAVGSRAAAYSQRVLTTAHCRLPTAALPLDAHGDAHAAADAQRRETLLGVAAAHLVEERDQDAGARGADRMADGDCAAVDVHDLRVPAHVLVDGERLRREGLVRLDEVEVLDLPAGPLERLARGRDRAGAHDRRIDAGGRPGGDAGERRQAALLRLLGRHQHHRGGAVVDAGRVAGRHRAILGEGGLQLADGLDRRAGADVLVLVDDGVAFPGLDGEGRDLVLEPAGLLRRLGLVLRGDGELVLVVARELPLRGDVLGRVAHVVAVEGVHQAVLQHRVDEPEVAHLGAGAHVGGVRRLAHRLHAAGDDDVGIAVGDLLHADGDGAQPRAAELVQAPGGLLLRDAGVHRRLAGRVLALAGGEHLAEDDLVDLRTLDLGARHGRLDRRLAEVVRRRVGEGAVEGPDRGPGRADDDDILPSHGCSPREAATGLAGSARLSGHQAEGGGEVKLSAVPASLPQCRAGRDGAHLLFSAGAETLKLGTAVSRRAPGRVPEGPSWNRASWRAKSHRRSSRNTPTADSTTPAPRPM